VQLARALQALEDSCSTQATSTSELQQKVKQLEKRVEELEAPSTGRQQPLQLADSMPALGMLQEQVGHQ
jgi:phage shock protein A